MASFGSRTPYRIETARTIIRCWNPSDAEKVQRAVSASVDSLLPWMPWAKGEPRDFHSKIDVLRQFRGSFDLGHDFVFGVLTKDDSEVIGGCGLHTRAGAFAFEIGYWINVEYQNQGYATEVTRALVKTAFELSDIDNIQIRSDVRNKASIRVIEKVGFAVEGTLRHRMKDANDEFSDSLAAILLRDDYARSRLSAEPVKAWNAIGEAVL